tara:strand:- start:26105 stop:26629 length:525 start_codon:yes stop_codon:yes gene_type:complete
MLTVCDWIPENAHSEFNDILERFGDQRVVKEVDGTIYPFPKSNNPHKHISNWILLEDGSALGWNESPRNGWNFIHVGKRAVDNFYEKHDVKDIRSENDTQEINSLFDKVKCTFSYIQNGSIFFIGYTENYKFVYELFIEEASDLTINKDDTLLYSDADKVQVFNNKKELVYSEN